MLDTLSAIFGNAMGVAVSPLPLIVTFVLLLTDRGRTSGTAFVLGWFVGVFVLSLIVLFLGLSAPGQPTKTTGWVNLVLGVAFVFLALQQWRRRPQGEEKSAPPAWFEKLGTMPSLTVFGLGAALVAINAKNTALIISAALTVGAADLTSGQRIATVAIFAVITTAISGTVLAAYFINGERAAKYLGKARDWLIGNSSYIMAFLFGYLGLNSALKGAGILF